MRYITNSKGYLQEVSFGADVTCGGQNCTEYTGAVPDGYKTIEDWFLQEHESLYRWKIVSGNLVMDGSTLAPAEYTAVDHIVEQGEKDGWTYRIWASGVQECWLSSERSGMDFSKSNLHSGFYYLSIAFYFPFGFSTPPVVVADGGSQDFLNFLRVSHVYNNSVNLWVYSLENIDTDTTVKYHIYAKGKAITETSAVLGTNVLGRMKLGG